MHIKHSTVELLHRVGNPAVECLAFTDQEVGIDGLARQRMAESELLGRLLNDQLGGNQLLDELEKVLFVMMGELLQEGKVEAASGYGRQGQDLPGGLTESIRALLHGILNAARDGQLAQWLALPATVRVGNLPRRNE